MGRGKVGGGIRAGGREILVGMYCMREESIFNLKKKKINTQLLSSVLPSHSIINLLLRLLFCERPTKFLQDFLKNSYLFLFLSLEINDILKNSCLSFIITYRKHLCKERGA